MQGDDGMSGPLLKWVTDKVRGFDVKRINSVSGIYVVDVNGYIGIKINDYFSQNGSPYPGNFALVAKGPDYSGEGLGRVTFIDNLEGSVTIGDKTYRTVVMPDGREWMAENLDFLPSDGSIAKNPSGSSSTASAWYYKRDEETYGWTGKKYGLLYNYPAALSLTIAGWHLPTAAEWDNLFTACGGASSCGTKLKSTQGWKSGNGTDLWGFTSYPSGQYNGVSFFAETEEAHYLTSTMSESYVLSKYLESGSRFKETTVPSGVGRSVRLIKDA